MLRSRCGLSPKKCSVFEISLFACRGVLRRRRRLFLFLFLRENQVGGESGSADTARDPRGFAVKFYSEEGNWDMVGNNTPIFFIRDPILFPRYTLLLYTKR